MRSGEGYVVEHAHVRKQGVALEHHAEVALFGAASGHVLAAISICPESGSRAGNGHQQSRLADPDGPSSARNSPGLTSIVTSLTRDDAAVALRK